MTIEEALCLPAKALLLTPYEPRGIVELVKVEKSIPPTAIVRFTHDHAGYPKGMLARYSVSELELKPGQIYEQHMADARRRKKLNSEGSRGRPRGA